MIRKPITGKTRKIHLYHSPDGRLWAMSFYDAANVCLYDSAWKVGYTSSFKKRHEILLNEGEQIVGFVSGEYSKVCATHYDF